MSETVLRAQDLTKSYRVPGGDIRAVRGISLTLKKGTTLAIVGESGCGKSTLGRMLVGLESPDTGAIDRTSLIPMVFQDSLGSLHPRRKVETLLVEPLLIREKRLKLTPELRKRAETLAQQVGLSTETLEAYPHQLSGGQRQRVNIARALSLEPSVLLLDEPVSALDVSIQAQILNLLMDLQDQTGLSIIFISHDLSVVRHLAHEVAVLYLGSVVESGPTEAVMENPRHPYTQALLASDPSRVQTETLTALKGEPPSPFEEPSGCAYAGRCRLVEDGCRRQVPPLKNIGNEAVACFPVIRALEENHGVSSSLS